ncbi:glycosyltransferase 87 family protein [Corynebacterium rouxii]|nr:glycosyltransferase 87 family protein [Corynebacterium rouxii]
MNNCDEHSLLRFLRWRSTMVVAWLVLATILVLGVMDHDALFMRKPIYGFDSLFIYHYDFGVYYEGAKAFAEQKNLYTQGYQVHNISLPFTYPPFAALAFVPFTILPVRVAALLFDLGSVVALWWCSVLVTRAIAGQRPEWTRIDAYRLGLVVTAAAAVLEPMRENIWFAQINVYLILLVLIDTLARKTLLPRGVLVGIAAAIKLTPAVFGLYFLIKRDFKAAAWSIASGVGMSALAWGISPENSRSYWLDVLHDSGRIGELSWPSNQSLKGVLARLFGADTSAVPWALLCVVTIALIAWIMHKLLAQETPQAAVVAVCINALVALLCSPVSWSHHWLWIVFAVQTALLVLVNQKGAPRRMLAAGALSGVVAMICQGHWLLPRSDRAAERWPLWQHIIGDSYVILAVASLIAIALWLARPWTAAQDRSYAAITTGVLAVYALACAAIAIA